MNEALLIALILITGITFYNLVKKIGVAAPFSPSALPAIGTSYHQNFGSVIYSGSKESTNNHYNNLWSVTATTEITNPVLTKITVIYHQYKKPANIFEYAGNNTGESLFTSGTASIPADVCVSSNISDTLYRHVLLAE